MSIRFLQRVIVLALAMSLIAVPAALSAGVLLGNYDTNDATPFGAGNQVQLYYDQSLFTESVTISSLTFFDHLQGDTFDPTTYTFILSTTTQTEATLSPNFAANVGGDAQVFATVNLSGPVDTSFSIQGTPFTYNPANGSLLIEIDKPGSTNPFSAFIDYSNSVGGIALIESFDNSGTGSIFTDYGAQILISPEPGTLALLATGMLSVLGLTCLRHRRAGQLHS